MNALYIIWTYKYGRKLLNLIFERGTKIEWSIYMISAAITHYAMFIMRLQHQGNNLLHYLLLLFIIWSFAILCYAIINTHKKSEKSHEADYAANVISTGQEYYQKINQLFEDLVHSRHDFKYHLKAIGELVYSQDIEGIRKYLLEVETLIPEEEMQYYCTNAVFNALLSNYSEKCKKMNIHYEILLDLPKNLEIPNYEMCIIMGNLLENAVEACEKLPLENGERGKIKLSVKTQGDHLAIMVNNDFNGIITEENGQLISAKESGGFGLRSIRAICARYNGNIFTEWEGKIFTAYIMLTMRKISEV
jgi:hypothetical protein